MDRRVCFAPANAPPTETEFTISDLFYYLCAILLLVANLAACAATMFNLPGNWAIVGFTALFAVLCSQEGGHGVSWTIVFVAAGLAALGELIEFIAGAAGAAKKGASRRAMLLAIVGAMAGSLIGAMVGLPVPVVGSILGAVGGGGCGAFGGAFLGELWKGRTHGESFEIGKAALIGRLFGTVGKLGVGAAMVVVVGMDAFL